MCHGIDDRIAPTKDAGLNRFMAEGRFKTGGLLGDLTVLFAHEHPRFLFVEMQPADHFALRVHFTTCVSSGSWLVMVQRLCQSRSRMLINDLQTPRSRFATDAKCQVAISGRDASQSDAEERQRENARAARQDTAARERA